MPFLNLYKLTYLTYETLLKTPGTEGRQLRLSRAPSRTSILRSILISLHFINIYWDPCLRNKILLSPSLYICKFNLVKGNYWEYSVGVTLLILFRETWISINMAEKLIEIHTRRNLIEFNCESRRKSTANGYIFHCVAYFVSNLYI